MNQTVIQQALKTMSTPFYVFDTDAAAEKMARLRGMLPKRVQLCYAMKANPFLIRDLERVADHFEVCSPGEFRICELSEVAEKLGLKEQFTEGRTMGEWLEFIYNATRRAEPQLPEFETIKRAWI